MVEPHNILIESTPPTENIFVSGNVVSNLEQIDSIEIATTSMNITENIESNVQYQNLSNETASEYNSDDVLKESIDISRIGEDKKNQDFQSYTFKKQANGRSFQNNWLTKFPWLEYSKEKDAAFCYACRQFGLGILKFDFYSTK